MFSSLLRMTKLFLFKSSQFYLVSNCTQVSLWRWNKRRGVCSCTTASFTPNALTVGHAVGVLSTSQAANLEKGEVFNLNEGHSELPSHLTECPTKKAH